MCISSDTTIIFNSLSILLLGNLLPVLDHLYPLVLDLLHELLHHRMVELALGRVEKLLMRPRAVVTLLVLERLHHHVQPIQVLDELRLGRLVLLVFLRREKRGKPRYLHWATSHPLVT